MKREQKITFRVAAYEKKRIQVSYKNSQRMQVDKADWIIVENTHEPIIDQYIFDRV